MNENYDLRLRVWEQGDKKVVHEVDTRLPPRSSSRARHNLGIAQEIMDKNYDLRICVWVLEAEKAVHEADTRLPLGSSSRACHVMGIAQEVVDENYDLRFRVWELEAEKAVREANTRLPPRSFSRARHTLSSVTTIGVLTVSFDYDVVVPDVEVPPMNRQEIPEEVNVPTRPVTIGGVSDYSLAMEETSRAIISLAELDGCEESSPLRSEYRPDSRVSDPEGSLGWSRRGCFFFCGRCRCSSSLKPW
ncbi:hypothetical protein ACFE04_028671 [Oxalis oulophora]